MREETIVSYFADDGTPFEQNKDACKIYEELCQKYKTWLRRGDVMFWNHYSKYINFDLIDYTFANDTAYLDWLLNRLRTECGYIVVNVHPCSAEWSAIWEFAKLYGNIGSECDKIEKTYCVGDLLNYDERDSKWHNLSLLQRNVTRLQENLMNDVAAKGIELRWRTGDE